MGSSLCDSRGRYFSVPDLCKRSSLSAETETAPEKGDQKLQRLVILSMHYELLSALVLEPSVKTQGLRLEDQVSALAKESALDGKHSRSRVFRPFVFSGVFCSGPFFAG